MEPLRVCRFCGLPAFNENDLKLFILNADSRYGHGRICKQCRNKNVLKNKGKEKPKKSIHFFINGVESKTCTKCSKTLSLENFHKFKPSWDGLAFICKDCLNKYQREWMNNNPIKRGMAQIRYKNNHPEKYKETQENTLNRRLTFKGKLIHLPEEFRINKCSECGKVYPDGLKQRTQIHHIKYDENDVLKSTIELCRSCHMKLHWKLRRENK
jgi:hypothetical protein